MRGSLEKCAREGLQSVPGILNTRKTHQNGLGLLGEGAGGSFWFPAQGSVAGERVKAVL